MHLCWRIGREAGAIVDAIHRADISWGYYCDHLIEPHNNCHPNNLIVLAPVRGCLSHTCVSALLCSGLTHTTTCRARLVAAPCWHQWILT